MADTVETLRAEIDKLRAEFNAFKAEATPVIDSHKPVKADFLKIPTLPLTLTPPS